MNLIEDLIPYRQSAYLVKCENRMPPALRRTFALLLDGVESFAELARIEGVSRRTAAHRVHLCRAAFYRVLLESGRPSVWRKLERAHRALLRNKSAKERAALARRIEAAKHEAHRQRRRAVCVDTGARVTLLYFGRCRRLTSALRTDNGFYKMMIKDPVAYAWLFRVADELALQARQRMDGPPPPAPTVCSGEWKKAKGKVTR